MNDLATLLAVVDLLYDSVLDEAKWPQALQALSDFVGGTGIGHVIADPLAGVITACETVQVAPELTPLYVDYYRTKEVRLAPALSTPVGIIMTEDMLIERRTLERSEIYGDLLLPFDVPHFMFAWLQKRANMYQTIAIEGSKAHGPFQAAALERFSRIVPHLIRAVRMREALFAARQSERAYLQALQTLPFGIILLDETGKMIEATTAAEDLLQTKQGLTATQGRIRAVQRDDDRRLQQAINNTVRTRAEQTMPGDTLVIRRADSRAPLSVAVVPLATADQLQVTPRPAALMMVVDPERAPQPPATLIEKALHLTRAEAILANALFTGVSLREAAQSLGRSINTCKAQLKSIYAKTGCSSHVELVKRMMMASLGQSAC